VAFVVAIHRAGLKQLFFYHALGPLFELLFKVLLACALAPTDDFGFFAPVDVRELLSGIMKHPTKIEAYVRHLHAFSESDRGPVLERRIKGTRRPRFRFVSPLLQPYVLLRGVDEGVINEQDLEKATAPTPATPGDFGPLFETEIN